MFVKSDKRHLLARHPHLSKETLSKHILNNTDSENCWAIMFVKTKVRHLPFPVGPAPRPLRGIPLGAHSKPHWPGAGLGAKICKTRRAPTPRPGLDLHPELSKGSRLKHIVNHTGSGGPGLVWSCALNTSRDPF